MAAIASFCGEDQFLRVRYSLCRYCKGDCDVANALTFILNILNMKSKNSYDRRKLMQEEMWFPCPGVALQEQLGMTDNKQGRTFKKLVEMELIEKDHRQGNITWLRVNADKLKKIEEERKEYAPELTDSRNPETGGQKPRNGGTRNPETGGPINKKENLEDGDDSVPPSSPNRVKENFNGFFPNNGNGHHPRQKKEPPVECIEWGKTLRKILKAVRPKLFIQEASYVVWAEWMHKLWKKIDKDTGRMDRLFAYFAKNAGKSNLPEITSAKQFHDRADWIERELKNESIEDDDIEPKKPRFIRTGPNTVKAVFDEEDAE